MNKHVKDIIGERFGSLTALYYSHSEKRSAFWVYKCRCGKEHTARSNTVTYMTKKYQARNDNELPSCGCVELARKTKHGFRQAKDTHPAYRAYRSMLNRCYNTNDPNYKWYGAIGVTVCDEWLNNPKAFVEWSISNGWKDGLHIDKDIKSKELGIEPGIYSPSTCQWVTAKVNVGAATNRDNYGKHPNVKLTHKEVKEIVHLYNSGTLSGPKLAKKYGVSYSSVYKILKLSRAGSNEPV